MKIKEFACRDCTDEGLKAVELEVNAFTTTHNTIDIKVNTISNNFGFVILYTVLYKEE